MTKTTEAEFDALIARAGLILTAAQRAEIYQAYGAIERMIESLRRPRSAAIEPATILSLERDHRA